MPTLSEILKADSLAEILDDHELQQISAKVMEGYEIDVSDPIRQEKADKWEAGQKIVKQTIEAKNVPFNDASNVKFPLLTNACIQFNARAYPAIVSGNSVVRPQMAGEITVPEEIKNMTEEEAQQIPPEQMQQLQQLAETISRKQSTANRACEYMNWQLFNELEEWEEDTDRLLLMLPLYGDMFRKTWYSSAKKRLESKVLSPEHLIVPSNTPSLEDAPRITEIFTLYPNQIEERVRAGTYIEFNYQDDQDKAHEFLEQHGWFDLDEDGYKEPYIAIVHKETGNCVQVIPSFMMKDVLNSPNDKKQVSKINRINLYTRYSFIPSSDGSFYSLGFFDILYPINEVVDSTLNILMDSGRLANSSSGFLAREARIRKGSVKFGVGEWKSVPVKGDDLRKGIFPLDFKGPDPALIQLLDWLVQAGREVANIKDVMTGEQSVNLPATTTIALIKQGMAVFSAIHKRIYRALRKELGILREWNVRVIPEMYSDVMDAPVSPEDFEDTGYDFVPVADPEVSTDELKSAKAEFLLSTFRNDFWINQELLRRKSLEIMAIDDIDELIQKPDQSVEQLMARVQQLEAALQKVGQGQLELQKRKIGMEEVETASKAAKAEQEITESKAKTIDLLAQAEAREAGTQLNDYKAKAEALNDRRARISELVKSTRNQVGTGGT